MYFRYFVIISPWKRAWSFIRTNLNPPLPKDALICQVWLKLAQWFKRRFLNFVYVFCYFIIISPWKRTWSFVCTNLTLVLQVVDKARPRDKRIRCRSSIKWDRPCFTFSVGRRYIDFRHMTFSTRNNQWNNGNPFSPRINNKNRID